VNLGGLLSVTIFIVFATFLQPKAGRQSEGNRRS
jgi:hypothetical protein